jgi:hypothetical protein
MTELVKISKNGGNVFISIKIETILPWNYIYVDHPNNYPSDSTLHKPFPHKYSIGFPEQINFSYNNWEVDFINPTGNSQKYNMSIEWYQDGNPNPIHVWPKPEEIEGELKNDQQIKRIKGEAKYYAV